MPSKSKLRIALFNARSIRNKWSQIVTELNLLHPDIVCITECWLSDEEAMCFKYNDFSQFSSCRNGKRGGGVIIFIDQSLSPSLCNVGNCNYNVVNSCACDCVSVSFKVNDVTRQILSLVYRPPNVSIRECDELLSTLTKLRSMHKNLTWHVLGDFNLPHVIYKNSSAVLANNSDFVHEAFFDFFDDFNLTQLVLSPTRNASTLDLFLTTNISSVLDVNVTCPIANCDHNTVIIDLVKQHKADNSHLSRPINRRLNIKRSSHILQHVNWPTVFNGLSTVDEFVNALMSIIDNAIPVISASNRPSACKKQPVSKDILRLIRKKRRLWSCLNRTPLSDPYYHFKKARFKYICNCIRKNIRANKKATVLDLANNPNVKKFYRYVNRNIKPISSIHELVDSNGNVCNDDLAKAHLLNSTFTSNYAPSSIFVNTNLIHKDSAFRVNITYEDTLRILSNCPPTAAGPDGISGAIVKALAPLLARPLLIIYQQSINQCTFPSAWKIARIVPIFKGKGSRQDPKSYRPVSLCNVFGKCLERLIIEQLVDYIEHNNILSNTQHGFRTARSTVTNLLSSDKYIAEWINSRADFDLITFDMSKAFDKVSHNLILKRLCEIGLHDSLVSWFHSFLTGRKQFVAINSATSPLSDVTSGIVQGSACGPILYDMFIDPLTKIISVPMTLFADDFKFLIKVKEIGSAVARVEVQKVDLWCTDNEIALSIDKCHCMHKFRSGSACVVYTCGSAALTVVDVINDLGVLRSQDGSYSSHAAHIASKAKRLCGTIKHNVAIPNAEIGWKLFQTYVRPILSYASVAWNSKIRRECNLIEKVQRSFTKYIFPRNSNLSAE